MKKSFRNLNSIGSKTGLTAYSGKFYSVEFAVRDPNLLYQFKIWNNDSENMFVLVKEDSDIVQLLNVGDIFSMKYYSNDQSCPTANIKTVIRNIAKQPCGRFKGHYQVNLALLEEPLPKTIQ
jgi:hypothetical protein